MLKILEENHCACLIFLQVWLVGVLTFGWLRFFVCLFGFYLWFCFLVFFLGFFGFVLVGVFCFLFGVGVFGWLGA